MPFPKDTSPGIRLLIAFMALRFIEKNRAECERIEKIEPPAASPTPHRAEAIVKFWPVPYLPDYTVKAAHRGINEIQNLLRYAPHLTDGGKVSFSIVTSRTGSTGTQTNTFSAQFEPNSIKTTAQRKLT